MSNHALDDVRLAIATTRSRIKVLETLAESGPGRRAELDLERHRLVRLLEEREKLLVPYTEPAQSKQQD